MQLKRANMQIQKLSRQYALNLADAIANEVKWTPKLGQFLAVA
jgi:hypothetical protein